MKHKHLLAISLFSLLPFNGFAFSLPDAMSPQDKGLAIAKESERRDDGWQDSTASMKMILINRNGEQNTREIRIRNLEVKDDGDKGLTIFDSPRDVKGTAFLSFTHALEPDEQWLFLPALNRVKRISSANKSGPFMGSEFAFEDLSSFEVEKFSYELLREEEFNGQLCYVSKLLPQYEHSGYKFVISWMDKKEFRPQKIEFYDRKGSLLKTQTFANYQQYLDQYWRAHEITMINHQTGKKTILEWSDYQFKQGLSDRDFNQQRLKNIQ